MTRYDPVPGDGCRLNYRAINFTDPQSPCDVFQDWVSCFGLRGELRNAYGGTRTLVTEMNPSPPCPLVIPQTTLPTRVLCDVRGSG
eukprot:299321-Rhodomonas_salina.2